MCELPAFPGPEGQGPSVLQFLEDSQVLAACGAYRSPEIKSCYSLSMSDNAWNELSSLVGNHCSEPWGTRSHYLNNLGWLVIGQSYCSNDKPEISSELFWYEEEKWMETPISTPYKNGYPSSTCSVKLNDSHVMVTGGNMQGAIPESWILNLEGYGWTPAAPTLGLWVAHGCCLNAEGNALVAGGIVGADLSTVYIYDTASDSWSEDEYKLPDGVATRDYPTLFRWNGQPILLEHKSDRIWIRKEGTGWELMGTALGEQFEGNVDTAVLVSEESIHCPTNF